MAIACFAMSPAGGRGPTALLLTAAEARRFDKERPVADAVMTLSPRARAALGEGTAARHLDEPLSDWAHARITARAHRAVEQFAAALDSLIPLRPGTRHALRSNFLVHAYLAARVWETLRCPGPWLLPAAQGWDLIHDRETAHQRLVDHLNPYHDHDRPPPWPGLYRLLRRLVLRLLRRRGPWLLSRRPSLVFGLDELIEAEAPELRRLVVAVTGQGLREYHNLASALKSGLFGRDASRIALTGRGEARCRHAVHTALDRQRDPVIASGLTPKSRAMLAELGANCEALFADALDFLKAAAPHCYVTRQDSGQYAVVADAAGVLGVPRYVVNYNTFPLQESVIASKVLREQFLLRMPEELSDSFAIWSPHMAATARRVYGPAGLAHMRPMRLEPTNGSKPGPANGLRRVLYAGNYAEFANFVPWIMETSNEFLRAVLAVVERVEKLPDVDLTIRVKPKGECPPDTLRKFIRENGRLHVTGTKQPYSQAVADADLVISFSSTTIEEAIRRRTPVLLWGPVRRYRHLPGRATPPTANSRAAVYSVTDADELCPMITAILDAHAGHPLTDQEIADHVWPEGTPGVPEIARLIAQGARSQ
jgi:hypothetical protein